MSNRNNEDLPRRAAARSYERRRGQPQPAEEPPQDEQPPQETKPKSQLNVTFLRKLLGSNSRHNEGVVRQEASTSSASVDAEGEGTSSDGEVRHSGRLTNKRRRPAPAVSGSDSSSDQPGSQEPMTEASKKKMRQLKSILKHYRRARSRDNSDDEDQNESAAPSSTSHHGRNLRTRAR